jgi:hypothetical protein
MRKPVGLIATFAVLASLVLSAPAWAAGQGEQVGEKVGQLLGGWAKTVYPGVAGLSAVDGKTLREAGEAIGATHLTVLRWLNDTA